MENSRFFKIDEFVFDTKTYVLRSAREKKTLGDYEAKLLMILIAEFGSSSDKDTIKRALWGDTSDSNFYTCYHNLRESFGDRKDECLVQRKYRLAKDPIPLTEAEAEAFVSTRSDGGMTPPTSSYLPAVQRGQYTVDGLGPVGDISYGQSRIVARPESDYRARYEFDSSMSLMSPKLRDVAACYLFPLDKLTRNSARKVGLLSEIADESDPSLGFLESGRHLAALYIRTFGSAQVEAAESLPDVGDDDGLVVFGSAKLHPNDEIYGERPRSLGDHTIEVYSRGGNGFRANPLWEIQPLADGRQVWQRNPFDPQLKKMQMRRISVRGEDPLEAEVEKSTPRNLLTDYLLITALPRDHRRLSRVVTFCGLYYTGTLAVLNLLHDSAGWIFKSLDEHLQGRCDFQVLVTVQIQNDGNVQCPTKLLGAKICEIQLTRLYTSRSRK